MKKLLVASLFLAAQFAFAPLASAADKPVTPQQQRMKDCNAEAKTKALKGDERKMFMKECLGGKKAEAKEARSVQQDKMKTCNADAKTKALKGDERKTFMSDCLKK